MHHLRNVFRVKKVETICDICKYVMILCKFARFYNLHWLTYSLYRFVMDERMKSLTNIPFPKIFVIVVGNKSKVI